MVMAVEAVEDMEEMVQKVEAVVEDMEKVQLGELMAEAEAVISQQAVGLMEVAEDMEMEQPRIMTPDMAEEDAEAPIRGTIMVDLVFA
jgi:hypothetical protein